jgi:hypothetical protein
VMKKPNGHPAYLFQQTLPISSTGLRSYNPAH